MPTIRTQRLFDSFNAAIEGFLFVIKTERNMRIHFMLAIMVMLLGIHLNFDKTELMILCLTVTMVLVTEMFNTGIEVVLDHVRGAYSRWVKMVKDIAAGAVLIASLNAVVVGYILFFKDIVFQKFEYGILRVSQSNWHISFIILITVVAVVILAKTLFHKGTPLRGGMPSGHSAVAFAVWALVSLISRNPLLVFIVLLLAVMVAQSRIGRHYHTLWEVFTGSAIGILITVTIYRVLAP